MSYDDNVTKVDSYNKNALLTYLVNASDINISLSAGAFNLGAIQIADSTDTSIKASVKSTGVGAGALITYTTNTVAISSAYTLPVSGGVAITNVVGVSGGVAITNVAGVSGGVAVTNTVGVSGGVAVTNIVTVSGGPVTGNIGITNTVPVSASIVLPVSGNVAITNLVPVSGNVVTSPANLTNWDVISASLPTNVYTTMPSYQAKVLSVMNTTGYTIYIKKSTGGTAFALLNNNAVDLNLIANTNEVAIRQIDSVASLVITAVYNY
jgi:hypothetical protein